METERSVLRQFARTTGLKIKDLEVFYQRGVLVEYSPGDWLFHESTPRRWAGLITDGEVEIIRGTHGSTNRLAVLGFGAFLSESALLDDLQHATGAFTRKGAVVWQISHLELDRLKKERPAVFYRVVARVAQRIADRLRKASELKAGVERIGQLIGGIRKETDSLGERELPANAYYGVQTARALDNFRISGIPLSNFKHLIDALAFIKKAAALANCELDELEPKKRDIICQVCDEILDGQHHEQFVVDMFQGGAGTSTNMNANEVIANLGLERMNRKMGNYAKLHPNDDVNCSQSTNDVYPTSIKIAAILSLKGLIAGMEALKEELDLKALEFADVLKMGRTENQDAVPMTLGQEFRAYAVMISSGIKALLTAAEELYEINMGATAIGTGLNSPPGYADLVTEKLVEVSGLKLRKAADLVESTQNSGCFVQFSGSLKRSAVQISKICNDLRWLSSGPRCGLNEIDLPPVQPGSSIMPGKVNPVIPELVNQVCYQIIGYDSVISMAAEASELELNMAEPLIVYDLLHGMMLLKNACISLASRCISGIKANRDQCRFYVENSIGLATALNPHLGYEKAAAIAKEALASGGKVYDLVLKKGWLTQEKLDDILKPENMTDPRKIPKLAK